MSDESDGSDGSDSANDNDPARVSQTGHPHPAVLEGRNSPPTDPAADPGRGPFCIARRSRHEVPMTPGLERCHFVIRPR